MTDEEKKTLMNAVPNLLRFYKCGKEDIALTPGGFIDFVKANDPQLLRTNRELIFTLDRLIIAANKTGLLNRRPPLC